MKDVLQGPIVHRGHAIECRINAEHPEKFTPSAGRITSFHPPGGTGVRIDTAAYAEGVIPPYYDSLIAKLIVRGKDRSEAISRMSRALEMFIVEGVYTTIPLHRKILADPDFRKGDVDTTFIERFLAKNGTRTRPPRRRRRGIFATTPNHRCRLFPRHQRDDYLRRGTSRRRLHSAAVQK